MPLGPAPVIRALTHPSSCGASAVILPAAAAVVLTVAVADVAAVPVEAMGGHLDTDTTAAAAAGLPAECSIPVLAAAALTLALPP